MSLKVLVLESVGSCIEDAGLLDDWLLENNYSVRTDMPGFEGTWEALEAI